MAKMFVLKTCEKTKTGYRVAGVVGKHENGDDIAHADYLGSGGITHHPEENEVASLVSLESGRFHIILGNKTTAIELEQGESAFFSIKNGVVQGCITAKNNGQIHLNGGSSSATLFEPLNEFIEHLKLWLKTHTHTSSPSGGTTSPPTYPFTGDILNAQSQKVKLS